MPTVSIYFRANSLARRLCLAGAALVLLPGNPGFSQEQVPPSPLAHAVGESRALDVSRLERLEWALQSAVEENHKLAEEVRTLRQRNLLSPTDSGAESAEGRGSQAAIGTDSTANKPKFQALYDGGFMIRPETQDDSPFSLKINNQNTFRYSGFAREVTSWTDNAGNVNSISNSSDFLLPRGRLIFSGKALLPKLSYLMNIDYNTVSRNPIGFRAYALSYQFNRGLEVSVGQNKVPGSREWLLSSWVAQQGPDRSMATTFFRPSLSQGIWVRGEPLDRLHYHAMVSNGFNTLNRTPSDTSSRVCWSGSSWWEPWGDFGAGYSDIEHHDALAMRVGSSYTLALNPGNQSESDAIENSSIRLSDGTLISQPGALAPGVTLRQYDLSLAAIDLALKYRGWGVSSEVYFQDLSSLEGSGPLPFDSTSAFGGFLQGGFFVLPQEVELYARTSWVTGEFGSGTEIAAGVNWFILPGKNNLRFTFDVAEIESSPAEQNRTGFEAGMSGMLFRTQINSSF